MTSKVEKMSDVWLRVLMFIDRMETGVGDEAIIEMTNRCCYLFVLFDETFDYPEYKDIVATCVEILAKPKWLPEDIQFFKTNVINFMWMFQKVTPFYRLKTHDRTAKVWRSMWKATDAAAVTQTA